MPESEMFSKCYGVRIRGGWPVVNILSDSLVTSKGRLEKIAKAIHRRKDNG
jgi:hypothetical protein